MIFELPYPLGLDYYVSRANKRLFDFLLGLWTINGSQYNSFPRAYRNAVAEVGGGIGYYYEAFDPTLNKYVCSSGNSTAGGLFFEDKGNVAAVSYWGLRDTIKKTNERDDMAVMEVMFFVNLAKITPGGIADSTQRLDEVAINDVKNFINNNGCGFSVIDTVRDVDKVLERCSGAIKKSVLDDNMQPKLCFKIIVQCPYNPQINIENQPTILMPLQRSIVLYIKTSPDTSKTIAVGNGLFIYQEYAPGATLQPLYTNSNSPYLAGRNVQLPFMYNDNVLISTPDYNMGTGTWSRANVGNFNDGEYTTITAQDTQHSATIL